MEGTAEVERPVRRRRPRTEPDEVRRRLVRAALKGIATHGYVDCTVAQIVSGAQMSRRAFYTHFDDREDCLLAAYEHATGVLLREMSAARGGRARWPDRPVASLDTYLAGSAANPGLARAFTVEIHRSGPTVDRRRTTVLQRWAAWLAAETERDLTLPGPAGVRRRALTVSQARGVIAAHQQMVADTLVGGGSLTEPGLRADMIDIELSMVTSGLPVDLGEWLAQDGRAQDGQGKAGSRA